MEGKIVKETLTVFVMLKFLEFLRLKEKEVAQAQQMEEQVDRLLLMIAVVVRMETNEQKDLTTSDLYVLQTLVFVFKSDNVIRETVVKTIKLNFA